MSVKKLIAVSASLDLQDNVGLYIHSDEVRDTIHFSVKIKDGRSVVVVYDGTSFAQALEQYKYEREMRDFKDHLIRL